MSEAKHTAGPWSAADRVVVTTMETHHYMTWIANCSVGGCGSAEQLANARLIAAAPELLGALQGLVKNYDIERQWHSARGKDDYGDSLSIVQARAALAKATEAQ